jgi:uncharacterized protein (DUF934 family)
MLDMLPLLRRCGFDSALLLPGQNLDAAERALGYFPGHYQADVLQTRAQGARPEA